MGQFTFRDKSVIDYVIATPDCFRTLENFETIDTDPLFTDGHNVLSWKIKVSSHNSPYSDIHEVNTRPPWIAGMESTFSNNIDQDQLQSLINQLNTYPQSQQTIEYITMQIQELFHKSASLTFPQKNISHNYVKHNTTNKPWFGPNCHNARQKYHKLRNSYKKHKSAENKCKMHHPSKEYKKKKQCIFT